MEKLYKRLAVTFVVSAVLSVVIFGVSLYFRGKAENGRHLDQLLFNVEMNLEHAMEKYGENFEYQKGECLRRARSAEYIAANDARVLKREGLEILKGLMQVKDISLIGPSGEIFLSTNASLEGTGENEDVMEQLREKQTDADRENGEETPGVIRADTPGFADKPEYLYAVAASDADDVAAVRVDADLSRLELVSGKELTDRILQQSTTDYRTNIFAVGKETGNIFGMTENNSQTVRIENVREGEDMLEYLAGLSDDKPLVLRINGDYQSAWIRDMGGMYLVAFSGMDRVTGDVFLTFCLDLAVIGLISGFTLLLVRRHLQNYMIQLDRARKEAEHDRLTGLYNRNGFERRTEEFLTGERPLGTFLLFDLDNFKQINDREGHPEGDRVLRIFAGCLISVFRREDVAGRLGGDEFAVLLRNPVPDHILREKMEAFREEVRRSLGPYYGKYRVSTSIGAVPVDGTVRDYRQLYRCADTALYIAKYRGKDCFYINDGMIDCMKSECTGCRADCPRSRVINQKGAERPDK